MLINHKVQRTISLNMKISMIFNPVYIIALVVLLANYMFLLMFHFDYYVRDYIIKIWNNSTIGVIVDINKTGRLYGEMSGDPEMKYHYQYKNSNGQIMDGYQYGSDILKKGQKIEVSYSAFVNGLSVTKDISQQEDSDKFFLLFVIFELIFSWLMIYSILQAIYYLKLFANGEIAINKTVSISETKDNSKETSNYNTVDIEYIVSDKVYKLRDIYVPKIVNEYMVMYLPEKPSNSHLLQTMFWYPRINNDGDIVLQFNSKTIASIGIILHSVIVVAILLRFVLFFM